MSDVLHAWAAGLIDGEGHLRIEKKRGYYHARIHVAMCHRRTIERLQTVLEGSITKQNKETSTTNLAARWQISNRVGIYKSLQLLRTYLFTKADEADILLEFTDPTKKLSSTEKEVLYQRIRLLNSRSKNVII